LAAAGPTPTDVAEFTRLILQHDVLLVIFRLPARRFSFI
jgi:hypothetical protein